MSLLLSLLALCLPLSVPLAHADGSGPISPFPTTGAFNATFVRDQEHLSIIEFVGDYNRDLPSLQSNVEPRAVVAKEFFRTHPDNYDFLIVFSTFEFDTGEAAAFQWAKYKTPIHLVIRAKKYKTPIHLVIHLRTLKNT